MADIFTTILVVIVTLLASVGSTFLKKGAKSFNMNPLRQIRNHNLIIGVLLDCMAASIFIYALRFGDLAVLFPLTSLSYVWIAFLGKFWLKENISKVHLLGTIFIIAGVILVGL